MDELRELRILVERAIDDVRLRQRHLMGCACGICQRPSAGRLRATSRPAAFYEALEDSAALDDLDDFVALEADYFHSNVRRQNIQLLPPGDCAWPRHNELQRIVRRECDRPRNCELLTGCNALRKYGKQGVRCANARHAINNECYRGGDLPHWRELRTVVDTANNCRARFRARDCASPQFFD